MRRLTGRIARPAAISVLPPMRESPSQPRGAARREDLRLITGRGRFVHDLALPGMLHAVFARSPHARARFAAVDTRAAARMAGVRGIFVAADVAGLAMPVPNPLLAPIDAPPHPLLADGVATSVGQPVALVVAESRHAAEAAAEALAIDYASGEATTDHAPDAPPRYRIAYRSGASAPSGAALRVAVRHRQPRVISAALETRATLAQPDGTGLTVWLPTQSPSRARDDIAATLGLASDRVRVIAPDVGGAFGAKASVYPEDLLVALAAQRLGLPVKWAATRGEDFLAATHGRGAQLEGALWLDADGHFVHLEARMAFPLGAWLPYSAAMPLRNAARILPGPYRVAGIDVAAHGSASDAAPLNIYRGAGRPEAALLMERLVDAAARTSGRDPVALRRLNLVPADAMPHATPTGERLDSGDYPALLERACARFGYEAERARQAERRAAGEWVGIGVALYVEPCGQGWESARITLDADGSATVASGSAAQGQGHETTYAQIAADVLGIDAARVAVLHGDTAACPDGIGALASRSIAIGGSAVAEACAAAAARRDAGEALPLTAETVYRAPGEAWSSGCVMVRLAIDADTGTPAIERLVWVDDAGLIVSPQLACGQLVGGLAQGLGQALMERVVYDGSGQLLTGSFLDYALPRAADMPTLELDSLAVPATANRLGAKGVGEAGTIGVPAAILNAAIDALGPAGVADLDFPLTPERLWRTIHSHPRES